MALFKICPLTIPVITKETFTDFPHFFPTLYLEKEYNLKSYNLYIK